ncbi:MAG: hypothetical protein WCX69_05620 [Candidatus Paceibacterota bacterium]
MNKKILAVLAAVVFSGLLAGNNSVLAKNNKDVDVPEVDGVYDVAGRPDLKVRVIVHKAKPAPVPDPVAMCVADGASEAVVDAAGWKLPASWTYSLNAASVPLSVGGGNLSEIAANAFAAWSVNVPLVSIVPGLPTFVARAAFDGKNIIAWGTASSSALAITYIWYNTASGIVSELDTIINKKYVWKWADQDILPSCGIGRVSAFSGAYDAQSILTHELGHWYGLNDHYTSDFANNTMYGYGFKGDAKYDTLTNGDIAGLKIIYGN